jgi:hypothetical protein
MDQWTRTLTRDTCFLWAPWRRIIRCSRMTETVKYGHESQGTRTRKKKLRSRGQQNIQTTDPSSRQRGRPTKQDCNCQLGSTPRPTDWLTDWLTVSHNVTLTLTEKAVQESFYLSSEVSGLLSKNWQEDFIVIWGASFCVGILCQETISEDCVCSGGQRKCVNQR